MLPLVARLHHLPPSGRLCNTQGSGLACGYSDNALEEGAQGVGSSPWTFVLGVS